MPLRRLIAIVAMALILTGPAFAADWVVLRLRGDVQVFVEGNWVPLKRGDVVSNDQLVRTQFDGHAELQRDKEVVTLGSGTQIRIQQDSETGYTTVLQDFGRVEVDAEAKRVKHFEVQTPYLAAVVKGTHFVVTSDGDGASVAVDRGSVAVQSVASERSTTIGVGQTATVKRKLDLTIGGPGPWPAIRDPGVNRTRIVAAIGGAEGSARLLAKGSPALPQGPDASGDGSMAPAPISGGSSGSVRLAAASSALFTGFAAANPASASADVAQPVSSGIVLIGALLGAALGALALLLRRSI
jgi:hypothetical protein